MFSWCKQDALVKLWADIPSSPSGRLTMLRLASSSFYFGLFIVLMVFEEGDGRCVRAPLPA